MWNKKDLGTATETLSTTVPCVVPPCLTADRADRAHTPDSRRLLFFPALGYGTACAGLRNVYPPLYAHPHAHTHIRTYAHPHAHAHANPHTRAQHGKECWPLLAAASRCVFLTVCWWQCLSMWRWRRVARFHGSVFLVLMPVGSEWPLKFQLAPWMRSPAPPVPPALAGAREDATEVR